MARMPDDTQAASSRVQLARQALATEREADAAVDRLLAELTELPDDAMERVLSRLVALLQGAPPTHTVEPGAITWISSKSGMAYTAPPGAERKVATFDALPGKVQAGARELKRLSGLPEQAVCERVMGWVEVRGEDEVAGAFAAMREERPSHELSFLQDYLNVA